jgi:hypothetical protein
MIPRMPGPIQDDVDSDARRRAERDWILDAIVGAIAAGKLPPDDACAWAKIAACEVGICDAEPSAGARC